MRSIGAKRSKPEKGERTKKKKKKESRFVTILSESAKGGGIARVMVDTETGIQYLFVYALEAGGLTILADEDGKPLINEEYRRKKD